MRADLVDLARHNLANAREVDAPTIDDRQMRTPVTRRDALEPRVVGVEHARDARVVVVHDHRAARAARAAVEVGHDQEIVRIVAPMSTVKVSPVNSVIDEP